MNRLLKKEARSNERRSQMEEVMRLDPEREARLAAIQMLIPIGLKRVEEELQEEVKTLTGERYARGKAMGTWGRNRGSVYLGDQKVRVAVPRVRRKDSNQEVPLMSYERLQSPQLIETAALNRVINGISQKKYEKAVLAVPETFGIGRGSISQKWIRASAKRLQDLLERDLSGYDIVALFLDGKTFGANEIILALGITITGEKVLLGFIEANTENFVVCRDFIHRLVERGLNVSQEILCVLDGGKGLRKGLKAVLGTKAVIQRCQWHKRENVLEYLNKEDKSFFRGKLQAAYEEPDYEKAKNRLGLIKKELQELNQSAVNSLEEGLEETLTLHWLGLFTQLGKSLKTTNCLENVNRMLGIYTDRVCRWRNSDHRRRWVATALLEIEPGLRKVNGYRYLRALRMRMKELVGNKEWLELQKAA